MWYAIWIIGLVAACGVTIVSVARWEKKRKGHHQELKTVPRMSVHKPLEKPKERIPAHSPALKAQALTPLPKKPASKKKVVLKKKSVVKKGTNPTKIPKSKKGAS